MSELKAVHAFDVYEAYTKTGDDDAAQVYLKSEADKVIAELKKEIEEQKRLRDMALASVPNVLKVMKIIRHHQYKRCLAMARWCDSENYTACWYHENSERCEWTEKWRKRWLAIAEKFKPNSTAQ